MKLFNDVFPSVVLKNESVNRVEGDSNLLDLNVKKNTYFAVSSHIFSRFYCGLVIASIADLGEYVLGISLKISGISR